MVIKNIRSLLVLHFKCFELLLRKRPPSKWRHRWWTGGGEVVHAFDLSCLIPKSISAEIINLYCCLAGFLFLLLAQESHCAPPPVSNIFLRPSMPDMASTFLRQSPTSEVSTWDSRDEWTINIDAKKETYPFLVTTICESFMRYLVLFDILLLHRLEVSSEVHGALVFGAQQSSHHLICWHPHLPQGGLLELTTKVLYLQLQLVDLKVKQHNQRTSTDNSKFHTGLNCRNNYSPAD